MNQRVRAFVTKNWQLVAMTVIAVTVVLWFVARLVLDFIYFHDPNNYDVELKEWMTPRFIVLTYDLPRSLVAEILELPPGGPGRRRLGEIADDLGLTLEELTERVRVAAEQYRAQSQ